MVVVVTEGRRRESPSQSRSKVNQESRDFVCLFLDLDFIIHVPYTELPPPDPPPSVLNNAQDPSTSSSAPPTLSSNRMAGAT